MVTTAAGGQGPDLLPIEYSGLLHPGSGRAGEPFSLLPQDRSASSAFHTLRGLLATLNVTTELLTDFSSLSSTEIGQLVGRLQRGVVWLDTVMENLAVTAAAASGNIPIQRTPVSLSEWIEPVVSRVEPLFEQTGRSIRPVFPSRERTVLGDSRRLQQALLNLVINASTYGATDCTVEVTVSAAHDQVEVRVTDRGPGIPMHDRERIFEPYFRGDVGKRQFSSGLGLGLHVAKVLIESHRGAIGVDTAPGRGSSFWIRLSALAG